MLWEGLCVAPAVVVGAQILYNLLTWYIGAVVFDFVLIGVMLIPSTAWFGLLLLYMIDGIVAARSSRPCLLLLPENIELQKAIRTRQQALQKQMNAGQLQKSIFWNRRSIEMKLAFFALDILSDANCILTLIRTHDSYGTWSGAEPEKTIWTFAFVKFLLASLQFFLLIMSAFLQQRSASFRLLIGELSDVVFEALLKEKTFEAPVSLILQTYGLFFSMNLNVDSWQFYSTTFSILLSLIGITEGLYMRCHLCLDETLEESARNDDSEEHQQESDGTAALGKPVSVHLPDPPDPPGLPERHGFPLHPPGLLAPPVLPRAPVQVTARKLMDTE